MSRFLLVIIFNITRAVILPYVPNSSLLIKEWGLHKLLDGKLDCEFCGRGACFKRPQHSAYFWAHGKYSVLLVRSHSSQVVQY